MQNWMELGFRGEVSGKKLTMLMFQMRWVYLHLSRLKMQSEIGAINIKAQRI